MSHRLQRVIVSGCCGRMGSRLITLLRQTPAWRLAGAVESPTHPSVGQDVGECLGQGSLGVRITADITSIAQRGAVLIEFSTPHATTAHATTAARLRCPMVIGTTALSDTQLAVIRRASRRIPIVVSPNMSLGVNVLFQLAVQAVRALGDGYDVEIVETHHAGKRDAPSGTAKRLAHLLATARHRDLRRVGVYGRRGDQPRRSHREIGIHAIRAGDVIGDHQVIFATPGERVELVHRASSRDAFLYGALQAARFVVGKPPRLYDMQDVLGLTRRR